MTQGQPPHRPGGYGQGPGGYGQGGQQGGYGQAGYSGSGWQQQQGGSGHPPAPPSTPGVTVAALVLGLTSLFMCGCVFGLPAIIVGHIALSKHNAEPHLPNRGMAVAGLVLGYVATVLSLLVSLFYLFYLLVTAGSMV